MANIRIKDQTTDTALVAGDYVIVDNETEGTRKFDLGQKLADIDDDFTDVRTDLAELEGGGLSDEAKQALLACFQHTAFLDDDEDYYQNLYDALYSTDPPTPSTVSYITCVYTQSGTVYDTDTLNSLKTDLVVTAHYSDSTTATVTTYTLSGTLTEGTSTITVSYGGKTTTFTVTVTAAPSNYLYEWDLTQSLIDSVNGQEIVLNAGSGVSNASRDSGGLHFNAGTQNAYLGQIEMVGKTIEIDVASFEFAGNTSSHARFLMNAQYTTPTSKGLGSLIYRNSTGWTSYGWSADSGSTASWSSSLWDSSLTIDAFNGKTVKVVYDLDGHTQKLYLDDVLIGTLTDIYFNNNGSTHKADKIFIGGQNSVAAASGDQCYNMTITGIRIYANE